MANTIGFGQAAVNNTNGFGQGAKVGASESLLLDTYSGASVAYSLRKLSSSYSGSAIRVRRSSDNTEQDIGFTGNELDTTSLTSFVGANDGYITTIYDQSGNNNNLTQSTASNQGVIVSIGTINTVNSKPCINLNASPIYYEALSSLSGNSKSFFMATKNNGADSGFYHNLFIISSSVSTSGSFLQLNSSNATNSLVLNFPFTTLDINTTQAWTSQSLLSGIKSESSSSSSLYKNGTSIGTGTGTQNLESNLFLNRYSSNYANQQLQEFVIYDTDETSNRTGIETNINNFYSIY